MKRFSMAVMTIGLAIGTTLGLAGWTALSSSASAQTLSDQSCYPSCAPPTSVTDVLATTPPTDPTTTVAPKVATVAATPSPTAAATTGSLAFTGSDIVGLVVVALLLVGGGVLIVGFNHRRSQADS
jgi:hypothetical protein